MNVIIENEFDASSLELSGENPIIVQFKKDADPAFVLEKLDQLCAREEAYYQENNTLADITYDLKGLPTETLMSVMKFALSRESLVNSSIILNVNLLINGYNTLDDSLFESPAVYVEDLEQLLDFGRAHSNVVTIKDSE